MRDTENSGRYTSVAVVLHWMIAFFILFNLITGSFMESLTPAGKDIVVPLHTSSGISVLGLSVLRLIWRLTHRPPPFDPVLSKAERYAARTVHAILYVMMISMPLIGWGIQSSSARKAQAYYFFVVPTPKFGPIAALPAPEKAMYHENFVSLHTAGAWIMLALLLCHVAGALKHQFLDRRPQLARMWFGRLLSSGNR